MELSSKQYFKTTSIVGVADMLANQDDIDLGSKFASGTSIRNSRGTSLVRRMGKLVTNNYKFQMVGVALLKLKEDDCKYAGYTSQDTKQLSNPSH